MSFDAMKFENARDAGGSNDRRRAESASAERSKATGNVGTPARNWAWANHDSYDWMDTHTPFSRGDSAN